MMGFLLFIIGVLASLSLNNTKMALKKTLPRCVEDVLHLILRSLQRQIWQNYLQSKKDGTIEGLVVAFFVWIPVNEPLPVINSLTLPQSNEVETSEKTNFTHQHKGFTAVFFFLIFMSVMSLELLWKMENRLTFTDQHLLETCRCNSVQKCCSLILWPQQWLQELKPVSEKLNIVSNVSQQTPN